MTIQADSSPIFPACPTFGFSVKPRLLVKKTELESGRVFRDRKWLQGLRVYEAVPLGNQLQAEIEEVLHFFWAIAGESIVFRFKDWSDYKSCVLDDDPAATDQPFETLVGSPSGYRLVKRYTTAGLTEYRRITRPKGDTITIANELGVVQDTSRWVLDESTGILTPLGTFAGVPTSWGGEFYVPVAFNEGATQFELTNFEIQSATVTLLEDRDVED